MNLRSALSGLQRCFELNPLSTVERACAITEIVASAEYLAAPKDRQKGGLNDWNFLKVQFPEKSAASFWNMMTEKDSEATFVLLHGLRVAHNLVLLSPIKNNTTRGWCNSFLVFSQIFLQPRQIFGTDGSDQLSFLGNVAVALGRLGGTDVTRKAASDFLALQVALSYFIAGVAKAPGAKWSKGTALQEIMGTETYGDHSFYKFLRKYPRIGRSITKGTVALESLFPLFFVTPTTLKAALLIFASFHVANAKAMGLGRFVLPFISTYPAMWALRTGTFDGSE